MTPMTTNERILASFTRAGPWALLAVLLVAFIVWEVRPAIASLKAEHMEMRAEMNNALRELTHYVRQSAYLEFRNCLNTATTAEQRERCAYKGVEP